MLLGTTWIAPHALAAGEGVQIEHLLPKVTAGFRYPEEDLPNKKPGTNKQFRIMEPMADPDHELSYQRLIHQHLRHRSRRVSGKYVYASLYSMIAECPFPFRHS